MKKVDIMELLKKTGRTFYGSKEVVKAAPQSDEGVLEFFSLDRYVTNDELEQEYTKRGLVPATLNALAEYDLKNGKDLDEKKWVATHWKDENGDWCCSVFSLCIDGRKVLVFRNDVDWYDGWRFAGLRKSGTGNLETKPLPSETLTLEAAVRVVKEAGYKIFREI